MTATHTQWIHKPARKPARRARVTGTKHGKVKDPQAEFSDDEWHEMVATAAYYRAEARGFDGRSPEDDWYEAEAELREQLVTSEEQFEPAAAAERGGQDMERG